MPPAAALLPPLPEALHVYVAAAVTHHCRVFIHASFSDTPHSASNWPR